MLVMHKSATEPHLLRLTDYTPESLCLKQAHCGPNDLNLCKKMATLGMYHATATTLIDSSVICNVQEDAVQRLEGLARRAGKDHRAGHTY